LGSREAQVRFFARELPTKLGDLSEADFEGIIARLWASHMWSNKTYLAHKIIEDNGIDKLRTGLMHLLNSADPEEAYGRFLTAIKGMGPASVTEILTYSHPTRCGIWNRQAREALKTLGITERVTPKKYWLSPQEYRTFNQVLGWIAEGLRRADVSDVDLLVVDFLFYIVARDQEDKGERRGDQKTDDFDHNEIRDLIVQIGSSIRFDTDGEVKVAAGAVVDAVWRTRIANLGLVTYVFEVQRSGSIDSLILNLQKAKSAPTVQKVIAVSGSQMLESIRRETEGLPEEFRKCPRFWPVDEVQRTSRHLEEVIRSVGSLGLIEDSLW
jgi:hypothetical protein